LNPDRRPGFQEGLAVTSGYDAMPFRVSVVRSGHRAVVRLSGELDCATAPELEAALADLTRADRPRVVVVEAAGLTFADVVGLGLLIDTAARLAPDGRLRVRGATPQVARVLTLLGQGELLDER
jgi:anti-sigma B factor antagonist